MGADVSLLPIPAGRFPESLSQAVERGIDHQHDKGEIQRPCTQQDRRGDEERSALQDSGAQYLRGDSIHARTGYPAELWFSIADELTPFCE